MSRYISKLPPEIRELAEKRRSEYQIRLYKDRLDEAFDWSLSYERWVFWSEIEKGNYSVFYKKYPQKYCTCNSRTVDETFTNVIHSTDCELYESKHPQKDKLYELIEWIEVEIIWHKGCESDLQVIDVYETILNKAKDIKGK